MLRLRILLIKGKITPSQGIVIIIFKSVFNYFVRELQNLFQSRVITANKNKDETMNYEHATNFKNERARMT